MSNKQLIDKCVDNIRRSLLLNSKEKHFWLEKIPSMPSSMVSHLFLLLDRINSIMDQYIKAAIAHDPDKNYLKQLQQEWHTMSKNIFKLSQGQDGAEADKKLEEDIQNLP